MFHVSHHGMEKTLKQIHFDVSKLLTIIYNNSLNESER